MGLPDNNMEGYEPGERAIGGFGVEPDEGGKAGKRRAFG
jgi:hypothetical protein